ncbi:MAG: alkane 1-monooxygenase, partial [bacterium]
MEAATHSHDHGPAIELNPAGWRDAKRYAWLLGLIVPFAPFIAWASVEATGFDFFWFFGPLLVFVAFPILDVAIGLDSTNPPDSVL